MSFTTMIGKIDNLVRTANAAELPSKGERIAPPFKAR